VRRNDNPYSAAAAPEIVTAVPSEMARPFAMFQP
jgi:hypothetical protein